jgi:hypothetical protein
LTKGTALGFADTYDMAELADDREAAVENARAGGIEYFVDTLPVRERQDGSDKILILAIDHFGRAEFERTLFLAARANRTDHRRPRLHGELGRQEAKSAADRMDENDVARVGCADIVKHMPGRQRLDRERGADVEADLGRQMHEPFDGNDATLGEAAGLFGKRRDAIADRHASYARADPRDPPGDFEPAYDGIALGMGIGSLGDHRVGEITAAIGDIDQRLSWSWRRLGRLRQLDIVVAARRRYNDRAHGFVDSSALKGFALRIIPAPQPRGRRLVDSAADDHHAIVRFGSFQ